MQYEPEQCNQAPQMWETVPDLAGGPGNKRRRRDEKIFSHSQTKLTRRVRRVPQVRFLNLGLGVDFSSHSSTSTAGSRVPRTINSSSKNEYRSD